MTASIARGEEVEAASTFHGEEERGEQWKRGGRERELVNVAVDGGVTVIHYVIL